MALLEHQQLIEAVTRGPLEQRLLVLPLLDETQIGPGSIDLRLGTQIIEARRRAGGVLDPFHSDPRDIETYQEQVSVELGEQFALHPSQFILGSTLEFIRMPEHLAGQVLGRSSWARLGLIVATAVVVQPGFSGSLTLELVNMGSVPLLLYPGIRIAQLAVWKLGQRTDYPYGGAAAKYQAPLGPESSRLGWEVEERDRILAVGGRMRKR